MRGTVAKRLREKVYGDSSRREKLKYFRFKSGQVVCSGSRADYLEEKAAYCREQRERDAKA